MTNTDPDNGPSEKEKEQNADQIQHLPTNSENIKDTKKTSSPSSECLFDWSPHADFNDFVQKLNLWIWTCQQWKHFHAQYPALSVAGCNQQGPTFHPPNQTPTQDIRLNANAIRTGLLT